MTQPVIYYQTDPRWKNIKYAVKGESSTIGGSGCGPSSMAMVLATWADKNVTPQTECAWALSHGYKCLNSGTFYSYFVPAAKRYGLTCTQLNGASIYGNANSAYHAQAKQAIDNNHLVIACMGKGNWTRSGHYVVVWKIQGNVIYINDPASTKLARTQGNYNLFKQQVKYYWVIKNPGTGALNQPTVKNVNYSVKINDITGLNCRSGAGTSYSIVRTYKYNEVVRISKEQGQWGYTGNGWINLTNTIRISDTSAQKPKEDELDMTKAEFIASLTNEEAYELVSKAMNHAANLKEPTWSKDEGGMAAADKKGIITGGRPESFVKRDEVAAMFYRLGLTK